MAKLKAHGIELARFVKDLPLQENDNVSMRKHYMAVFADRWILEKYQVRWLPDQYRPNGELHDWGWTRRGKLKTDTTVETYIDILTRRGYVRVGE